MKNNWTGFQTWKKLLKNVKHCSSGQSYYYYYIKGPFNGVAYISICGSNIALDSSFTEQYMKLCKL